MAFTVDIASVPDRDDVVAEIWFGQAMVAELQRVSGGDFRLEIYASKSREPWSFDLQEWFAALNEAQRRLNE